MLRRTYIPRISHASSHSENVATAHRVMFVGIRNFKAKSEEYRGDQDGSWTICTNRDPTFSVLICYQQRSIIFVVCWLLFFQILNC